MTVPTDPTAAARRLAEPDVTPAELAAIARDVPDLRAQVAAHPQAYPALREWISVQGRGPAPAPAPAAAPRPSPLPWVITAVSVVVALVSVGTLVLSDRGGAATTTATGSERGFATPEEAVEFFADRVAEGDLGAAMEAFGVTGLVEGYSFRDDMERIGAVTPTSWLPTSSDGYRAVDAQMRRGNIGTQMLFFVRAVAAPDLDLDVTLSLDEELTAADVETQLDPSGLSDFALVRVDELHPTPRGDVDPFARLAATYGADEMREVAVLVETSDGLAVCGMQLLRYGDEWSIWTLTSMFLGLVLGDLEPTTEASYESMVADVND